MAGNFAADLNWEKINFFVKELLSGTLEVSDCDDDTQRDPADSQEMCLAEALTQLRRLCCHSLKIASRVVARQLSARQAAELVDVVQLLNGFLVRYER